MPITSTPRGALGKRPKPPFVNRKSFTMPAQGLAPSPSNRHCRRPIAPSANESLICRPVPGQPDRNRGRSHKFTMNANPWRPCNSIQRTPYTTCNHTDRTNPSDRRRRRPFLTAIQKPAQSETHRRQPNGLPYHRSRSAERDARTRTPKKTLIPIRGLFTGVVFLVRTTHNNPDCRAVIAECWRRGPRLIRSQELATTARPFTTRRDCCFIRIHTDPEVHDWAAIGVGVHDLHAAKNWPRTARPFTAQRPLRFVRNLHAHRKRGHPATVCSTGTRMESENNVIQDQCPHKAPPSRIGTAH